jgi:hypothetical protein
VKAEELGFDAVFVNDHIVVDNTPRSAPWTNTYDPFVALSFIAANTTRIGKRPNSGPSGRCWVGHRQPRARRFHGPGPGRHASREQHHDDEAVSEFVKTV